MVYCVPIQLDKNLQEQGFFSVQTSTGHVVVVGQQEGARFSEFINLVARVLQGTETSIGFIEIEARSFAAAVQKIMNADPSRAKEELIATGVVFISDTDPLFESILDYFRNLAQSQA